MKTRIWVSKERYDARMASCVKINSDLTTMSDGWQSASSEFSFCIRLSPIHLSWKILKMIKFSLLITGLSVTICLAQLPAPYWWLQPSPAQHLRAGASEPGPGSGGHWSTQASHASLGITLNDLITRCSSLWNYDIIIVVCYYKNLVSCWLPDVRCLSISNKCET